jgi:hypothetical protein
LRQGFVSCIRIWRSVTTRIERREPHPSWDAYNRWSVALAEKLGYHFDHEYTAYEIYGY